MCSYVVHCFCYLFYFWLNLLLEMCGSILLFVDLIFHLSIFWIRYVFPFVCMFYTVFVVHLYLLCFCLRSFARCCFLIQFCFFSICSRVVEFCCFVHLLSNVFMLFTFLMGTFLNNFDSWFKSCLISLCAVCKFVFNTVFDIRQDLYADEASRWYQFNIRILGWWLHYMKWNHNMLGSFQSTTNPMSKLMIYLDFSV